MTQIAPAEPHGLDLPALRYAACLALGFVLGLGLSLATLMV